MIDRQLFITEILNNSGKGVEQTFDEKTVKKFKLYYKELLNEGYYLCVNKESQYKFSKKHPEKVLKQLLRYDEFCKNIFMIAD